MTFNIQYFFPPTLKVSAHTLSCFLKVSVKAVARVWEVKVFLFRFFHLSSAGPSRDGTISEDTIRASLISAVSDKLRWRMKEEMDRAQAELNALKRTEEDLKKGHQKLEEMVTRLDQEVVSNSLKISCYF